MPTTTKSRGDRTASMCPSLRLVIAAHLRGACITRQLNVIYQNPNSDRDCGRCSSCKEYPLPKPRHVPVSEQDSPPSSDPDFPPDTTPKYMRLGAKDVQFVANKLAQVAEDIFFAMPYMPEMIGLRSDGFLPSTVISSITNHFHLVKTREIFLERASKWDYLARCGDELWEHVKQIGEDMDTTLLERRNQYNEKQRLARQQKKDKELHDEIVRNGLDGIKRVTLVLPPTPSTSTSPPGSNFNETKVVHKRDSSIQLEPHPSRTKLPRL
ncbi:hypothetical protein K474DRAFT_1713310 [Panus rudis PR-1116 ss-1]|nr:hypothetical protein K474DRAFT_1713310 [Panus rudis PR-1116 ss-1]